MGRKQWKLTIKRGETLRRYFQLRNRVTGAVIDLADIGVTSGTLVIRPDYDEAEVVELTTDNGGVVLENGTKSNGFEYSGYITVSDDAALLLEPWGQAPFDFAVTDGVRTKYLAEGYAVLSPTTIT